MTTAYDINTDVSLTGSNPITQAELKNYIKQTADVTAENNLVDEIITAVVAEAQELTNKLMNTAATVTAKISIDEADHNGKYIFELPFENTAIGDFTSIALYDVDGDAVSIDSDDYRIQDNTLIMKLSYLNGYYLTLEYDITATESSLAKFKEALLAYGGYKYMHRSEGTQEKAIELFSAFISYKNWM